jgi:dTDP-4-amino-4,6-dideoxygalactose transaminase
VERLEEIEQKYGIPVFYDAAHAVGSAYNNNGLASFGHCATYSLHATKIMQAAEGGVVCTDDELAERIRNMRSSCIRKNQEPVPLAINGRFSELQAAMALLSLEKFPEYKANNKHRYLLYREKIKNIAGLSIIQYDETKQGNYQYIVFRLDEKEFGLSRDELVKILNKENVIARRYFIPSAHKSVPYVSMECAKVELPNTECLIREIFQLPSGQIVTDEHIEEICSLLQFIHEHAQEIKKHIGQ